MNRIILLSIAAAGLWMRSAHGQFIDIRLSYKAVLNPASGQRSQNFTDTQIDQAIARMNELQDSYGRGFRFVRVDPVTNIGGQGDTTGPSRWYSTDFFDDNNGGAWKDQMEAAARNDARYRWFDDVINLYITDGICGGICSFDFEGDSIIVLGGCSAGNGVTQLHEIGHYFQLFHTQGKSCGDCGGGPGQCSIPGDDEIADTLADLQCWGRDEIANFNLLADYADLTPPLQSLVDDVFLNVMSYHSVKSRLTQLQLDRWTDTANGSRRDVASGRTWFVDDDCGGLFQDGSSHCGPFSGPFASLHAAINRAQGGDIVLARPGNYSIDWTNFIPTTINKPVTLRAPRGGVTIRRRDVIDLGVTP